MKKIKVIALFGPAGAGKDAIQKVMVENHGLHGIISHTTRPMRENEEEGLSYYFISEYEFAKMNERKAFLEYTVFNHWWYGTSIESLSEDEINIGVFNIDGVKALLADDRIEVIPVYVSVSNKIRLIRQLNREKEPNCLEICRRFLADDYDFRMTIDFEYDTILNNSDISNAEKDLMSLMIKERKRLL